MDLRTQRQRLQNQKLLKEANKSMLHALDEFNNFTVQLLKHIEDMMKEILIEVTRQMEIVKNRFIITLQKNIEYTFVYQHQDLEFDFEAATLEFSKPLKNLENKLKKQIRLYLDDLLNLNLYKSNNLTILHTSNIITSRNSTWYSVSSKQPLIKSNILVQGFDQIKTTYIAIGVTTKHKPYSICKSLESQNFLGCIYLNGKQNQNLKNEHPSYKTILLGNKNATKFTIEDIERRLYIHKEEKVKQQVLALEDNVQYYLYIAWKGPIQFQVR